MADLLENFTVTVQAKPNWDCVPCRHIHLQSLKCYVLLTVNVFAIPIISINTDTSIPSVTACTTHPLFITAFKPRTEAGRSSNSNSFRHPCFLCRCTNWNSLPKNVIKSDTLATFKKRLKTHLFTVPCATFCHWVPLISYYGAIQIFIIHSFSCTVARTVLPRHSTWWLEMFKKSVTSNKPIHCRTWLTATTNRWASSCLAPQSVAQCISWLSGRLSMSVTLITASFSCTHMQRSTSHWMMNAAKNVFKLLQSRWQK